MMTKNFSSLNKNEIIKNYCVDLDVLDLGCVNHLYEHSANPLWLHRVIWDNSDYTLGIDILKDECRKLRKDGYNVRCADALKFRSKKKFDLVVMGDLVEHVDNPGLLLKNAGRNMRKNGLLLVSTPNPFGISQHFNFLGGLVNPEHTCWFCEITFRRLAENNGFEVVELIYYNEGILWDEKKKRLRHFFTKPVSDLISRFDMRLSNNMIFVLKKNSKNKKKYYGGLK